MLNGKAKEWVAVGLLALSVFIGGMSISQALIGSSPIPGLDTVLSIGSSTTKTATVGGITATNATATNLIVTGSCTGCGAGASDLETTLATGNSAGAYDIDLNSNNLENVAGIEGNSTNSIAFSMAGMFGSGWLADSNQFMLGNSSNPATMLYSINHPMLGKLGGVALLINATDTQPIGMFYSDIASTRTVLKLGDQDSAYYTGKMQIIGKNGANYYQVEINPSGSMTGDVSLTLPTTTGTLATTAALSSYVAKTGDTMTGALTVTATATAVTTSIYHGLGPSDTLYVEHAGDGITLDLYQSNAANNSDGLILGETAGTGKLMYLYSATGTIIVDNSAALSLSGSTNAPYSCDSAHDGYITYNTTAHYYCFCQDDGTAAWMKMDGTTVCGAW